MANNKILVPIDFSEVTDTVIRTAVYFAEINNMIVSLLHVETKKSVPDPIKSMQEIVDKSENTKIRFELLVLKGNLFDEISNTAKKGNFGFMIVGTHGHKGLREKLFGADILKLLRSIPIPVFTVQKNCPIPDNGYKTILFPAGSHETFIHKINATISFAQMFDSEVHLYSVEKPGTELSEDMCKNIRLAKEEFAKNNIAYKRVKETLDSFSVGFAKQIIEYGKRENIDLVALMANSTSEHYYIADSDKEYLLTNNECIPVLTTNDKSIV